MKPPLAQQPRRKWSSQLHIGICHALLHTILEGREFPIKIGGVKGSNSKSAYIWLPSRRPARSAIGLV
jgi:hypothetical protein